MLGTTPASGRRVWMAGRSQAVPIAAYDAFIAGQAVRRGLTLVTANSREFASVEGLMWEDWSGASNG